MDCLDVGPAFSWYQRSHVVLIYFSSWKHEPLRCLVAFCSVSRKVKLENLLSEARFQDAFPGPFHQNPNCLLMSVGWDASEPYT